MSFLRKVLYEGDSNFNGKVRVEDMFGVRKLIVSDFTQSRSLNAQGSSEVYWDAFITLAGELSNHASILILGLAAGTGAAMLRKKFPEATIDGLEIDQVIVDLGKKYFDLDKSRINIIVADAEDYVASTTKTYDLVYLDVFIGGVAPSFASEDSYFEDLKRIMNENGEIIVNSIHKNKNAALLSETLFRKHFNLKNKILSSKSYRLGNLIMKGDKYD